MITITIPMFSSPILGVIIAFIAGFVVLRIAGRIADLTAPLG